MNNQESEIYADWYIVKQNIWQNWYHLINMSKLLVEYKIKGVQPQKSRNYALTCGSLYAVYRGIGESKYKKFLKPEQVEEVKRIAEEVIKGISPKYEDIQKFMDLTDEWFETSGMSQIDKNIDDPGNSVMEGFN